MILKKIKINKRNRKKTLQVYNVYLFSDRCLIFTDYVKKYQIPIYYIIHLT